MATRYSDQITKARALAAGTGYELEDGIKTTRGTTKVFFFSRLTTDVAQDDTIELVKLPRNSRILRGVIGSEALGTSVTLSVGTDKALTQGSGDSTIAAGAANLLAATSHASAAVTPFAATYALGLGARCAAAGETTLYATVAGAAPTTAKQIQGWVEVMA